MATNKRITLLTKGEIKAIYDYPIFSDEERQCHFYLSEQELETIETLATAENKVCFILMLGYFKAKTIFYRISFRKSHKDMAYIKKFIFSGNISTSELPSVSIRTTNRIKNKIYKLFNIGTELTQTSLILEKIGDLARYNIVPTNIFKDLVSYMQDNNIPLPAYATIQTLIGKALSEEEKRLTNIIDKHLPLHAVKTIDDLLTATEGLYPITALKSDPKSFRMHDLQGELDKHHKCSRLFIACKNVIPKFDISNNNINYYSSLAIYYNAFKLQRFPKNKCQLYIICFIFRQFYKINNNLIDGFVHYVRTYDKKADEYAKEEVSNTKAIMSQYQPQVGKILSMFGNNKLDNHRFKKVKQKAFAFVSEKILKKICVLIQHDKVNKKEFLWDFHRENHYAVTANLRPLFMAIPFNYAAIGISENLKLAAHFMATAFKADKPLSAFNLLAFPIKFIGREIKKYFFTKLLKTKDKKPYEVVDYYKYEYLVYQQIERGLHAGEVYSNTSVEYKSLNADLSTDQNLEKQKEVIQKANIPALTDDIRVKLNELKDILENLITVVNQKIDSGENKHVKIKKKNGVIKWTLPYKKVNADFNNPFYDKLPQINIVDLLAFVDTKCHFTDAFSHIKTYESTKEADYKYTLASILADATGLGIYKISESSNLNYDKLLNIHNSRIRLETLEKANNIFAAAIEVLPTSKYYNIQKDKLHGGIDGMKVDVRLQTFKSRYLRKYFKEKGVSAYTLLINNIAADSKIITGHESHFLFDVLYNNTSSLRPDIISTDNEGSNQLNFALLDLIGVLFAPCYKTIAKKAQTICTFSDPKHYQDCIIKPCSKVNESLIIEEWPNVQKIFISLLAGEKTQNIIVKKLSSHKRKSKTKDALWEYNNILMSIYLLWYIDDPNLRRYVRTALNRTEGYHQLRRAVGNVGGGDFRGKSEMEILIWNECSRLVANAIIYYNAYMLSQLLISKGNKIDKKIIKLLKRISPIAWQHINFLGMYDFSFKNALDFQEMLNIMGRCFEEELVKSN